MEESQSQWLFTESELLLAPSIIDGGLTPEKERENRKKGVNFILQAGIMLKLPQITLATASVYLHRFYMRESMEQTKTRPGYHFYSMAATCLFLATKVEENCRKMKELVVACVRVAQKDPKKIVDEQDKEYWRWRDNILHSEDILLEALCFDLSLEATYKTLFDMLLQFHAEENKRMRNAAWAFVNDSCLTQSCLLFPSRTIAASAFHAGARHAGFAIADDELGGPWWNFVGVKIQDIRKASNYMADSYANTTSKAGKEGMLYERTPEYLDDTGDQTRIPFERNGDGREHIANTEGERDYAHKRERASDDAPEDPSAQTHLARGKGGDIIHEKEGVPRKRLRPDNQSLQAPADAGGLDEIVQSHAQADQQQSSRTPAALPPAEDVVEQREANVARLVSPRLDDGSEEGEVDP